jgi:hypothetical protein
VSKDAVYPAPPAVIEGILMPEGDDPLSGPTCGFVRSPGTWRRRVEDAYLGPAFFGDAVVDPQSHIAMEESFNLAVPPSSMLTSRRVVFRTTFCRTSVDKSLTAGRLVECSFLGQATDQEKK